MPEYIEREALMSEIEDSYRNNPHSDPKIRQIHNHEHRHFLVLVSKQPAVDVIKVKRRYWKRQKGRPEAICSECGREVVYQTIDNKWWFENYCPHCGADMRKKGSEMNDTTGSN